VEWIANTHESDSGDKSEKCGVDDAGRELGAGGEDADEDPGHTGEMKD